MNSIQNGIVFEIHPENASIVENLSIKIHTNRPSEKYKLRATTKDDKNKEFCSTALFISDPHGVIDLTKQAPIEGSYEGVEPMGLIWSMKCKNKRDGMYVKHTSSPVTIQFKLYQDDQLIATKSITRSFYSEDVEKEVIKDDSIVGTVYPKQGGPYPALVIVGGSDASVHESAAAMLASNGYVVLALAYFGRERLPKGIVNIPIEYVDQAVQYLESKSIVNKSRIGIIGHSRGSELALLYALHFNKVQAVVAAAPSAAAHCGVVNFQPVMKPAWTVQGSPIPYFQVKQTIGDTFSFFYHWMFRKPFSGRSAGERNLQDEQQLDLAAIRIEEIQASILFMAGTDDHIWPSDSYAKIMEKRLQTHSFKERNTFIYYENAGHFSAFPSALPNLPQTTGDTNFNMTMVFGGTKKANAEAAQDSWKETLDFLKKNLK